MPSEAPVLFLVFNRPNVTQAVFDVLRRVKPKKLYVAADGPRPGRSNEDLICQEVRTIATLVDWDCELNTLFRNQNLGCGRAISEALTWFFEHEEEGIILEDDCLPSSSFFDFCGEMLCEYRHDKRIMKINGYNPLGFHNCHSSYFYSHFGYSWGWATWRRTWDKYSFELEQLQEVLNLPKKPYPFTRKRLDIFRKVRDGKIDTWDFQLEFCINYWHGIQIIPKNSLTVNLGFDEFATHTTSKPNNIANIAPSAIDQVVHPCHMLIDAEFERILLSQSWSSRIKDKLRFMWR